MPARGPGAVIFDFDGVIVDSESIHHRALRAVVEPLGVAVSDATYQTHCIGREDRAALDAVLRHGGRQRSSRDLDALIRAKTEVVQRMLRGEAVLYSDTAAFIAALGPIPRAIASGALRAEIDVVLARAALRGTFEVVVSAEDVRAGKPDPAPFLLALTRLQERHPALTAAACVAIEDTPVGVAAARRAGMRVVAVTHSLPARALAAADLVVETLGVDTLARVCPA